MEVNEMSRTNIEIDDRLIKEGLKLTGFHTKKKLVNFALEEIVRRKKRKDILSLLGSHCWSGNLNNMRTSRA